MTVLRLQGGLLTNTGYVQCGDEWGGGVSPHWSLPMLGDKHGTLFIYICFPSTYMEGVQNKCDNMAGVEHVSEKLVVMSWAWHKI